MSAVLIRDIESKDYLSVASVWHEAFVPLTDEALITACKKMEGDSRYRIFVAEVDGKVVGFVSTVEALAINLPDGYIKVNSLAVLPKFRCRGIGKMLMAYVEELAKERGSSLVELASGFQRTEAHEFYERLGYQKTSVRFSKRI